MEKFLRENESYERWLVVKLRGFLERQREVYGNRKNIYQRWLNVGDDGWSLAFDNAFLCAENS